MRVCNIMYAIQNIAELLVYPLDSNYIICRNSEFYIDDVSMSFINNVKSKGYNGVESFEVISNYEKTETKNTEYKSIIKFERYCNNRYVIRMSNWYSTLFELLTCKEEYDNFVIDFKITSYIFEPITNSFIGIGDGGTKKCLDSFKRVVDENYFIRVKLAKVNFLSRKKIKNKNSKEYIYLIEDLNNFKIGRASNLEERLINIRTSNINAIIKYYIETTKEFSNIKEKELHKIFDEYRVQGEWFVKNIDITNYFIEFGKKYY